MGLGAHYNLGLVKEGFCHFVWFLVEFSREVVEFNNILILRITRITILLGFRI